MDGRCYMCNTNLGSGDVDGLCYLCRRNREQNAALLAELEKYREVEKEIRAYCNDMVRDLEEETNDYDFPEGRAKASWGILRILDRASAEAALGIVPKTASGANGTGRKGCACKQRNDTSGGDNRDNNTMPFRNPRESR